MRKIKDNKMKKILIVEDDIHINNVLTDLLIQNRYDTKSAYSGTEAILRIEQENCDLILLDYMLPGLDGKEVIKKIKEMRDIPVIMLTAKDEVETKVELLKLGADDYITKPFNNEELLARIEVVFRRKNSNSKENAVLRFGNMIIDRNKFEAKIEDIVLPLTKREYLILELFIQHPEKVFTKSNLYESVWKEEFLGDENVINVHISNLRQKLAEASRGREYIKTIWGIGFKLEF